MRDGRRDQWESSESLITGAAVHSLLANWSIIQIVTTLTAAFTITAGLLSVSSQAVPSPCPEYYFS